ncbi:hypothetical protein [Streptomyces sp. NPDC051162]|uniref:hypothetical protein n=1 Tax=unclassified Streptomyces TaxID=2593676 RepID=UPI00341907CC
MVDGSLMVAGSGIKASLPLPRAATGRIGRADHVVCCVPDPVADVWIREHGRSSDDLYRLYGKRQGGRDPEWGRRFSLSAAPTGNGYGPAHS